MQRYEINHRTYIVHDGQLYRQEGSSNHPIDTEQECWDAVVFRGMVGEFDCHDGTCIFIPYDGNKVRKVEQQSLGETILKLRRIPSIAEKQQVKACP